MKTLKDFTLLKSMAVFALVAFAATTVTYADAINRQLQYGMSGSDVGVMQAFFSKDTSIYPQGLVTNYFGTMTRSAVMNFQARNGIATVGRVGPATLPVLNAAIANGNTGGGMTNIAPAISGINVSTNGNANSATIAWSTNELAQGMIYYSSSPLSLYENMNSVTVSNALSASTNANFVFSQTIFLQNLQPNTTYYYLIYVTDQNGNVSVYGPSTFRVN